MKRIEFYKLQASGNDFILLDNLKAKPRPNKAFYGKFAKKYCSRKLGIGADGVLVIEPSAKALFKMRIFNADGSEAEMCGNGARSAGLWAALKLKNYRGEMRFETKAGIIESKVKAKACSGWVKIKTPMPFGLKIDLPLKVLGRKLKVNFINTGVPHAIIFVEGLEKIDAGRIGREVRFHRQFSLAGTNVDFVELKGRNSLAIRTYERGVEAETLACGTGAVASAVISWFKLNPELPVRKAVSFSVKVKSGDTLKVTFNAGKKISDVWLEGGAHLVYKGKVII